MKLRKLLPLMLVMALCLVMFTGCSPVVEKSLGALGDGLVGFAEGIFQAFWSLIQSILAVLYGLAGALFEALSSLFA